MPMSLCSELLEKQRQVRQYLQAKSTQIEWNRMVLKFQHCLTHLSCLNEDL